MRITRMDDAGKDWLARLEGGYRLTAYKDSNGTWTISAGVTFYRTGRRVAEGDKLDSVEVARALYAERLSEFEGYTDVYTRDDLTQTQFNAVTALVFNIGPGGFATSTVRKAINEKVLDPWYAWKRWDKETVDGVLRPSRGLLARRAVECYLYQHGIYKQQGEVS